MSEATKAAKAKVVTISEVRRVTLERNSESLWFCRPNIKFGNTKLENSARLLPDSTYLFVYSTKHDNLSRMYMLAHMDTKVRIALVGTPFAHRDDALDEMKRLAKLAASFAQ